MNRRWFSRADACQAFARWLGFARTGPALAATARSLINGLTRELHVESAGADYIRRSGECGVSWLQASSSGHSPIRAHANPRRARRNITAADRVDFAGTHRSRALDPLCPPSSASYSEIVPLRPFRGFALSREPMQRSGRFGKRWLPGLPDLHLNRTLNLGANLTCDTRSAR